MSDVDDRTLEEIVDELADDLTKTSKIQPQHICKRMDRFVSYREQFNKHQVVFEDKFIKNLEECHNISEDVNLSKENIENYNSMYAPVIARIMADMHMMISNASLSNAQQYTLKKRLKIFKERGVGASMKR